MDSNSSGRKNREKQQRRGEIIAAACEVFESRGFADATLEEIAEKAEFGKGTIYNYFENKEDLFGAVIMESLSAVQGGMEEICRDSSRSFRDMYRAIASEMLAYLHHRAGLVLMIMREMHRPEVKTRHVSGMRDLAGVLMGPIERAMRAGEIRSCDPDALLYLFFMTVFGMFQRSMHSSKQGYPECAGPRTESTPEQRRETERLILQALDDTFFYGILSEAGRGTSSQQPTPTAASI